MEAKRRIRHRSGAGINALPGARAQRYGVGMSGSDHERSPSSDAAERPALLSLFCGAGGLDEGFAQAGFRTHLAYDAMPAAVASFNHNHGEGIAVEADLRELGTEGIIRAVRERNFTPVGVIGGPPCQGFSRGNVGIAEVGDPRNELPLLYANIIASLAESFDLQFFVFENVPGLLRARHAQRLEAMRSALATTFTIREVEVDAFNFGVPQHRPRML